CSRCGRYYYPMDYW
nr:immunoglobulin heavy chain junction region [Mus musculus]MBK4186580.1 immunoglobulin heavy chain junction region [Mus musculus]